MTSSELPPPAARINGEMLGLGNGLLMLIREVLEPLPTEAVVSVSTSEPSVEHDLPSWCRIMGHTYLGSTSTTEGKSYYFRKGPFQQRSTHEKPDWGMRLPRRKDGAIHTQDWLVGRVGQLPEVASTKTGFAPRGAVVEDGAPAYDFTVNELEKVWAAEVSELYEQATANQWDASHDIAWDQLPEVAEPLERALCQLMTFLTENEYSALYVPAKFVPRINPNYIEVVLFLCTQMVDEARHIEVFTKRALANGGGLQYSAASTQLSLKTLFDQHDFTTASFLLSVMGEGTFLDLLRFIELHAPDPVTAEICRRARNDETRHVHFGMAHVRYFLGQNPVHYQELLAAVRRRAEFMSAVTEVSPWVQEALAVLAAGGLEPRKLAEGTLRVRELMENMHKHRLKRLEAAGFTPEQAQEMSQLHTPNFM